ncbi:competence type IV pilus minor pilin ComGG [Alkalihalobacillus sp. AL-G]|uniref:competence type IV pilus minor pilin ComGG n=1 Tax=Alkalihalobacillus sp. AL-G TaxID=2926399 RepID=UPI00272C4272|nr:competence type IV pilus minor pilin ComGG [Alkalihalobacillus sp. AL-G]WLD92047.1 ComGG family competence protein [Alkalihalobacillus sp. AL-G]
MKNESGYITALAIMMTLIILSVIAYNVKLLSSEQLFLQERKAWIQSDLYLQMGREDLVDKIKNEGIREGESGTFIYQDGKMQYETIKFSDEVYIFRLEVILNESGRATGFLYYNYVKKEVVKWTVV